MIYINIREKLLQNTSACYGFYRAIFSQFYSYNYVYCVKLVKFIFILDSFAFAPQSFVIRTKTFVNECFCTIREVE